MLSLIQMQLTDMAEWNFHSFVLKGTGKSMKGGAYIPNVKLYYNIPKEEYIQKGHDLIQKMIDGETLTEQDLEMESED